MAGGKKIIKKAKAGKTIRQVAAIPFRIGDDGEIEILLVTSRTTQRFLVPKGWPMKGKSGRKVAEIEAREEAGVSGRALRGIAGTFRYWKRMSDGFVRVQVTVYLLAVEVEVSAWKEDGKRQRAWLCPRDAAILIDEPELASLVQSLTGPKSPLAKNGSGQVDNNIRGSAGDRQVPRP